MEQTKAFTYESLGEVPLPRRLLIGARLGGMLLSHALTQTNHNLPGADEYFSYREQQFQQKRSDYLSEQGINPGPRSRVT